MHTDPVGLGGRSPLNSPFSPGILARFLHLIVPNFDK